MKQRTWFLIGLLVELLAVFGLFLPQVLLLSTGQAITLRTVPVDPRDVFRGEYVMLGYEAGQDYANQWSTNLPVFVVLEKKGETFERVSLSEQKPVLKAGQVCLRGVTQYGRIGFPDIAQYFVEEGVGRELEQARNTHRLLVDAVVDSDCRAIIKGVRVGEEAPAAEPPPFNGPIQVQAAP